MKRKYITGKENEFLNSLRDWLVIDDDQMEERAQELLDDEHPNHQYALQEFYDWELAQGHIDVHQYNYLMDQLYVYPDLAKDHYK